jgi:CSLREA domain-containing protein
MKNQFHSLRASRQNEKPPARMTIATLGSTAIALFMLLGLCGGSAYANTITTFDATGTFQDGATLAGTLTIDTTNGDVLASSLAIPPDSSALDVIQGVGSTGDAFDILLGTASGQYPNLNLVLPVGTLVGYAGGLLASNANPVTTQGAVAISNFVSTTHNITFLDSGQLTPAAATPEITTLAMIGGGLITLGLAALRRRRASLLAASARASRNLTIPKIEETHRFSKPPLAAMLLVPLSLGLSTAANAANIVVNTLTDGSVTGACTLRDAITAANTDTAVNGCAAGSGADTITFSLSGTITLGTTLPAIVSGSTIAVDGTGQSVTVSGNNLVRVLGNVGVLQLKNLSVANGFSGRFEGGGGILNEGTLVVDNCTFYGNNTAIVGGAVLNQGAATLSVNNSTFSGNHASGNGGAIEAIGTLSNISVTNSTFSGNTTDSFGGAISNLGALSLINSTFSGNSGLQGVGGIQNFGTLNLANTILAKDTPGGDCSNQGTINPSGVNLVGDGSCSVPGALSGDPMLGPLANNGGPTMTMALLPGSPAIDSADESICAAAPVNNLDQRGQPRSTDGKCDIGAYESVPLADFKMTAIPSSGIVYRDIVGWFFLQLTSQNAFDASVTLSCSGGPAQSKCADLPKTVKVNGTAYALSGILFPRNTPAGTYTITYTGTSGPLKHDIEVPFTVK